MSRVNELMSQEENEKLDKEYWEHVNEEELKKEIICEKCGEECGCRLVGDELAPYCKNCNE